MVRGALAIALLAAGPAVAERWLYLARDEAICAANQAACVLGSLTFQPNARLLRLHGRVQSAPGPGLLTITVTGHNRRGESHYSPMEIRLRGKPGEIVDFKMIPDHPEVYDWSIYRVDFVADPE